MLKKKKKEGVWTDGEDEIGCPIWKRPHTSPEAGTDVLRGGGSVESSLKGVGCLLVVDGILVLKPHLQNHPEMSKPKTNGKRERHLT